MRISKQAVLRIAVAGATTMGMLGLAGQASAANYSATMYVAGMGGHFAKAEVVIDPAMKDEPITIKKLSKVDIGDKNTHPTHDPRIDAANKGVLLWSTYKTDKSIEEKEKKKLAHVGKTDLATGKVLMDATIDIPEKATQAGSLYCGSGQTKDYYLPVSMANKGYIDVFNKSDLKLAQRVFLEGTEADIKAPYKYYHGTNSPDFKKFLVTINEAATDNGDTIGKLHLVELDLEKLVKGEVKVVNKGLATGDAKKFISFRQFYSPDGSLIANSAGNTMLLIDAKTLATVDAEPMGALNENHDAMFTPDGKYIVVTQRSKALTADCKTPENPGPNEYTMDGRLRLYSVADKAFVGKEVSVCAACHQTEGVDQHAVLCGLEATWN